MLVETRAEAWKPRKVRYNEVGGDRVTGVHVQASAKGVCA